MVESIRLLSIEACVYPTFGEIANSEVQIELWIVLSATTVRFYVPNKFVSLVFPLDITPSHVTPRAGEEAQVAALTDAPSSRGKPREFRLSPDAT